MTSNKTCSQAPVLSFTSSSNDATTGKIEGLKRRARTHVRSMSFGEALEEESVLANLEHFLSTLERRLDDLEKYGTQQLDEGRARAHSILTHIHDDCSRIKSDMLSRAHRFVAILEAHYPVLTNRTSLTSKAHAGMLHLQELLGEFEEGAMRMYEREKAGAKQAIESVAETMESAAEGLAESIERAIQAAREKTLITYDELPHPWRVNPYITRGYRFTETKWETIKSAFKLNNETCNIWSHALGFVIVTAIALFYYPSHPIFSMHTMADKFISAIFFIAALKALACSAIWHTFSSIAHQNTMERFACVDYTGISLLIAASILTTEYTAFYNDPFSRNFYMALTTVLGIAGSIFPWHPLFNAAHFRLPRVVFYISLSCSGFLPILQLGLEKGFAPALGFYLPLARSLCCYLVGACIYAAQVPERWYPGGFDWVGGSHNIWHGCVVGGILFHWAALVRLFEMAKGSW